MSTLVPALETLTGALSPQEKRYIRLSLSSQKNAAGLLRCFNELCGQSNPAGKRRISLSASQISYLYRCVLKILRAFHEERTIDIRLHELLINAALLYEKRLYELSLRELGQAQELAAANERWPLVHLILSMKSDIAVEKKPNDLLGGLQELAKAIDETASRMLQLSSLKVLQLQVSAVCRTSHNERHASDEHLCDAFIAPLAHAPPRADSLLGSHHHLTALASYAYFKGDFENAFRYYHELLTLWDKHPQRTEADRLAYTRFLSNFMTAAFADGRFALIPVILEKLEALPVLSAEEEAERFQNTRYVMLLHLMNTNSYEKLGALTQEIEAGLKKYKTKVNKARELAFYHNLTMAWFLIHNWERAREWNGRLVGQKKTSHRLDLQRAARLFRLVLWYELGKHDLLEYELINVERFLRAQKAWFAYEACVVRFIRKLLEANGNSTDLFHHFRKQLEEVTEGKTSAALPCCSELRYWCESKIESVLMKDLIARHR